ncbi:MAG: M28 family peptidase [Fidelibacterota bacterium]|nr:MAG: M28 family peptidase [Candidatus Neomarinimicrobiota bacterium]
MRYLLLTALIFSACARRPSREVPVVDLPRGPVSTTALLTHATVLASDSLYGRAAGSIHERKAADYIRREFTRYGLVPAVPEYFQSFQFTATVMMGPTNSMRWLQNGNQQRYLKPDVDFRPLGFSSSTTAEGELVFAGYGISTTDPGYDDYADLDVNGKVVMILRYSPDGTSPHGAFGGHTPLRKKVLVAREKGAVAVIFVTGPADDEQDILIALRMDHTPSGAGLPVVSITRQAADQLLLAEHLTIAELQREINTTRLPISHAVLGVHVSVTTDLQPQEATSQNVLALLPGAGTLKGQWLILGAHYDHLGMGGPGSGSMVADTIAIHNGADDNASGTATLLEIARDLVANPVTNANRRSIMFQAFGGEEHGTLGSSYVTSHPPVAMDSIVAMLNMDMVGGLSEGKLVISGTGTSPLWKELLPALNSDSLHLIFDDDGFGGSDHQSYYLQDKPVLFFFTGEHERYHRPSDDVEFLNLEGMVQVGQLVARVTRELVLRPLPPIFARVETGRPGPRRGISVGIGVIPNFTYEGEGMAISGARGGGPAEKAGLQAGDVIVRLDDTEIKSIYDYMYALQDARPGVPVKVVVTREEEELEMEVIPELRESEE